MTRVIEPTDELAAEVAAARDEGDGFGALRTRRGCLPLVALDVRTRIEGLVSHVTVRQRFRNGLDEPLEATYIFPLPDRAAVTSFQMRVADRVVEGQLKERTQARADYRKAIEAGHRAAIAEEERSGTFNLHVGNIPPKEEVSVELTLVGPLPVSDGQATYRFPLVVAPRYVPGIPLDGPSVGGGWAPDTDQVPDASRVTPPVLLPGFPNPVQLSLEVELDPAGLPAMAGNWAEQVRSTLHSVVSEDGPPWKISLRPGERLNRDFILRFPVASDAVETTLRASPPVDDKSGTFALTLVPPAIADDHPPRPRDVVFVLDRSGSMSGWKMVAARRAVGRMVDSLMDQDRFMVLAFDTVVEYPAHAEQTLIQATDRGRWRTLEWLGKIGARGGTELGGALESAVRLLAGSERSREAIIVVVTDGQVAGEDVLLRTLVDSTGAAVPRVHALGIDRAVNAGFLRRLADLGGGSCDLVESEDQLDAAMAQVHRTIGSPVLTNLRLEPVDCEIAPDSLAPAQLPDLFADRPITVFGRLAGGTEFGRLRIHAIDAAGRPWHQEIASVGGSGDLLTSLWGRARVRDLEDRYASGIDRDHEALAKRIVEVSLESHVLSRFTAYVAVDTSEVVSPGGKPRKVVQPVEVPEGWEMFDSEAEALQALSCFRLEAPMTAASALPPCPPDASRRDALRRLFVPTSEAAALPKRKQPAKQPRTLDDAVAAIRSLLAKIKSGGWWLVRRRCLERLIELLETLARILGDKGHPGKTAVDELARRTRQAQRDFVAGDREAVSADRLAELAEAVGKALDRIADGTGPAPGREQFWA